MKKLLLAISLGLVLILSVTACSQDTKKEVKEATDAVKEDAKEVAEDVKKEADKVVDKAKEEAEKVKEEVDKAADKVKEETGEKEFTLDELKEYNGKDGKRAYVAVDGIVYDVTDSAPWKNGDHNGYEAGNDLTDEIKNKSPHGISKLENVVKIGVLKK